jgi:hypothetical protein
LPTPPCSAVSAQLFEVIVPARRELTEDERLSLAAWGARGLRLVDVAGKLSVSSNTLRAILQRDERAAMAWARGRAELAEELVGLLLAQARKGNIAAVIFATKAFLGFSETQSLDGGEQRSLVTINLPAAASPEAWAKLIDVQPRSVAAVAEGAARD